ncbi:MAG TPA: NAD(P)-dependent oxidoreductase, partial [Thermoleophilia bacterium]|nr:NAD(P)-dependent oxidoreductase [Thermoleophilia bacterium]
AGSRLQVVGTTGPGVDGIDVGEATRRGVVVVNAPESNVVSAGELALALLFACARGLAGADADLRAGGWEPRRWADGAVEVRGKTLGLFVSDQSSGLLIEAAGALGMRVLTAAPGESGALSPEWPVEPVDAGRLCAESDFIVVGGPAGVASAAGAPAAVGAVVLGAAEIAAMKTGVRIVDLSAGGGVEAAALSEALRGGRVAAAAVGVPGPDAPAAAVLAATPNVLLTPLLVASTADARLRAGMTVAEQVASVLRGELPAGAVNVPAAAAVDAADSMPHMGLCVQLGRLLVQLADAPVETVEITYGGSIAYFDTRLLTLGVLAGVLRQRTGDPVNYVNAEAIAADAGVSAVEKQQAGLPDFPRLITVSTAGPGAEVSLSGTTLGPRHKPRLVTLFGEDVDIEPSPHMAFLRYVDAPGIGGKLGTLLGGWGVNIAHMSVGRGKRGNESVMALTLDDVLTQEQADELAAQCGLLYARAVEL